MIRLAKERGLLEDPKAVSLWVDESRKIIAFSRGGLLFLFDFHATYSEQNFFLPVGEEGKGAYRVILSTDEWRFGGAGLVSHDYEYATENTPDRGVGFWIYAPARTAMVLEKV